MTHGGEKRNGAQLWGTGDHGVPGVIEALGEMKLQ